jgi:hypothetical protein
MTRPPTDVFDDQEIVPIMPAFYRRPKNAAAVGRIVVGYGELEIAITYLLGAAMAATRARRLADAPSMRRLYYERIALKTFMRTKGADARICHAKKYIRPATIIHKLEPDFDYVLGAIDRCRLARNMLAHCQYATSKKRGLFFADMEELSKQSATVKIRFRHASTKTLGEIENYLLHTYRYTGLLYQAFAVKAGLMRTPDPALPPRRPQLKTPRDLFPHDNP